MKERILQLAHGEVDIPKADVVIYPAAIDQTISSEYSQKLDLFLQSRNQVPVKAFVYSTDHRVVLSDDQAVGVKCSVHYEVMSMGMKSGSEITGAFQFVAQGEEFQVPYHFVVEEKADDDILPMVDTLEHFAQIVAEDPQKGLKMFLSRSFLRMPFMQDADRIALYEELALYGQGGARALEEFLCYLGAKEPVKISLDSDTWVWDGILEDENGEALPIGGEIILKASAKGYTNIELKSSSAFVHLAQNRVFADDFTDGECRIPFDIEDDRLLEGDNGAVITINDCHESLKFEILLENTGRSVGKKPARLERKKVEAEAYRLFLELLQEADVATLSFGVAKEAAREERMINPIDGVDEATREKREELLTKMEIIRTHQTEEEGYADLMLQLMHAYTYYINGRLEEFRLIMDAAYEAVSAIRKKDVELYCIYLYLRYLSKPGADQKETVSRLLKKYYVEQKSAMSILLMLLDVDDQLFGNDILAYEMLREQYNTMGSISPLLFLSACKILNEKPEKLKNLEGFELKCVIYGAKYGFLSQPLIGQIAQLALYEKSFRESIYQLLCRIYETTHSQKVLTALVCVLIVGGKKDPVYFNWYALGIENDVRLTGVYENYLDSLPKDYQQPLPDQVLLFCEDKDDLNIAQREVLYDNVITYFAADSKIYQEYKDQMEVFAIDQLIAGRYNKTLIRLYQLFLYEEMIDERIAQVLPAMLKVREITTTSPRAEWIVVRYPALNQEYRLRMKNGSICIPVYSEDALILFEDANQIRYGSFDYTSEALMENETFLNLCREKHSRDLVLTVLDTLKLLDQDLKWQEEVNRLLMLLEMAEIHPYCKHRIVSKLLEYCAKNDVGSVMDHFLLHLDAGDLSVEDRVLLIELLCKREYTKETYDILKVYGYAGVSTQVLMAIAKYVILQVAYEYDPFLLNICLELYREQNYNNVILAYLLRYFNGITDEMLDLMDVCGKDDAQVQMADFPERLLGQMMFIGRRERLNDVFHLYEETTDAKHLYMPLVQAYVSINCYDFFAKDAEIDEEVLKFVEQRLSENSNFELADVCKIALLKHYSDKGLLDKSRCSLAANLLSELYAKGYVFAFYEKLTKHDVVLPEQLNGKVILEYRAEDAEFVRLKRQILDYHVADADQFDETAPSYRADLMRKVFPKIFVETVTLFNGEGLLCSFVEEQGREVLKTTEIQKMNTNKRYVIAGSRFDKINQAASNRQMDVELEALLREITTADEMVKDLFPLQ